MLIKFLNMLKRDFWLKLLSVFIAIIIWYGVVSITDPIESSTFSVKISVINESYISNGKQIYSVEDQYRTVTVHITDNRSRLKRISAEDITVRADLTQIVDLERDPVMVPLSVSCPGIAQNNIRLARTAMPIKIENIASRQFAVGVDLGESKPGTNYEVGSKIPNPEQIVIRGPESIVNEIDTVTAKIDVTGMTRDGEKYAKLIIHDRNGNVLSDDTVDNDLTFVGNVENITVFVDLWKKRSNVGLDVHYAGTPVAGYHVSEVTCMPETITVVGTDEALNALKENGNKIVIPEKLISVEGAVNSVSMDINLSEILPAGLRLASGIAEGCTVTVGILPDESKEIIMDVDKIELKNMDPNLNISYDQPSVRIVVRGASEYINALTEDSVKIALDLKGKGVGDYSAPLVVSLPGGISLYETVVVTIHLTEKPVTTPGEANETEEKTE